MLHLYASKFNGSVGFFFFIVSFNLLEDSERTPDAWRSRSILLQWCHQQYRCVSSSHRFVSSEHELPEEIQPNVKKKIKISLESGQAQREKGLKMWKVALLGFIRSPIIKKVAKASLPPWQSAQTLVNNALPQEVACAVSILALDCAVLRSTAPPRVQHASSTQWSVQCLEKGSTDLEHAGRPTADRWLVEELLRQHHNVGRPQSVPDRSTSVSSRLHVPQQVLPSLRRYAEGAWFVPGSHRQPTPPPESRQKLQSNCHPPFLLLSTSFPLYCLPVMSHAFKSPHLPG